jgi:hypothetical protein
MSYFLVMVRRVTSLSPQFTDGKGITAGSKNRFA